MKPYYDEDGITIYHADCREFPITPKAALSVLTDPPYGIGANRMTLGNGKRVLDRGDSDWDAAPADVEWIPNFGTPAIVWGGNYFTLGPSRCWLVWDKGTGTNDYADCELAWTNLDMVVKRFTKSWVGANAKEKAEERLHPTQKPVSLMAWCLGFLPPDSTVLDPYMGSGSSLVAAKALGRKAIGIEIEERYCEIAVKRLAQGVLPL